MVKCTNLGCLKEYNEEDNSDASCVYHDGKAIFHEFKKGWTCCNQIVYDWDDFQKLKGCRVGRHTNKPKENNVNDLWKNKFDAPSNENTNTNNNIVKSETKEVIKDIGEYEREQQRIKEEKASRTFKRQRRKIIL